jgi:hypothetical protein
MRENRNDIQNFDEETLRKETTWNAWECGIMYVEDGIG